jgi:xylose isomerase
MSYDSVSRTLLGLEKINLPNIGILLDFGHALYGGESPADSAQLAIDYGRLFGMDVNDNLRSWDDDMIAGTVHPMELFEFFYVLRKNNWDGVWQLDQFPFREDTVGLPSRPSGSCAGWSVGSRALDFDAMQAAQDAQDAVRRRASHPTPCSATWRTERRRARRAPWRMSNPPAA